MAREIAFTADGIYCEGVAAQAWAFLAYPDDDAIDQRRKAEVRLRGLLVAHMNECGVPFDDGPTDKQSEALQFLQRARGTMSHFDNRLRRRMAAGNVAAALLVEHTGLAVSFPDDFGDHTISNGLNWLAETANADARNIEKRCWKESLPALNLAAALCILIQERQRQGLPAASILDLGIDGHFVGCWIALANKFGPEIGRLWPRRTKTCPQPQFSVLPTAQKVTVPS